MSQSQPDPMTMYPFQNTCVSIRVLMIGPGEGVPGGISSLVQAFVPLLRHQVNLAYIPTVKRRPLKNSGKISPQNVVLVLWQFIRFLYAVLRFRPQIIHLHTSQGIAWLKDTFFILVGKACGCRIVLHMHGGNFDVLYGRSSRLAQHYTRALFNLADAVIAVSAEWKKRLSHIVPAERVYALPNCIAVDVIPQAECAKGVSALFLGSVGPTKGIFDLLEAMSHLKSRGCDMHLWLAGYEEEEGDLARAHARLEELGLQHSCEILGMVQGARKAQLLHDAALFVLPSYREGLPMALVEAMAAGLPVVATSVGGIPDVVRDGYNGFLVSPGDVQALVDKLAILGGDPSLRSLMGKRSRQIAERELDVKPYVSGLVALYKSLSDANAR